MNLLDEINKVVDPAEFKTGKALMPKADGDKKRARARLHQMNLEITGLSRHIDSIKEEVVRLEEKLEAKAKMFHPEAQELFHLLNGFDNVVITESDVKTVAP